MTGGKRPALAVQPMERKMLYTSRKVVFAMINDSVNPEKGGRQVPLSDWKLPEGSGARLVKLKETGPVFISKQLDKGREKPYYPPKFRWKFVFRTAFPKSHCNNFSIKKE